MSTVPRIAHCPAPRPSRMSSLSPFPLGAHSNRCPWHRLGGVRAPPLGGTHVRPCISLCTGPDPTAGPETQPTAAAPIPRLCLSSGSTLVAPFPSMHGCVGSVLFVIIYGTDAPLALGRGRCPHGERPRLLRTYAPVQCGPGAPGVPHSRPKPDQARAHRWSNSSPSTAGRLHASPLASM